MAGFGDPRALDLLREVWRKPTYPTYQRIGRRIAELDLASVSPERAAHRRVRIAILSSFTLDPVAPYLEVGCAERDILPLMHVGGFNQFAQELLDPASALYAFKPDVCFLHVQPDALAPAGPSPDIEVDGAAKRLDALVQAFRRQTPADLVISSFAVPVTFPYLLQPDPAQASYARLNAAVKALAARATGVHVLDFDALASFHGKAGMADERLRHIARMELGGQMLGRLASAMLAWIVALRGFGRKCVVVDLDNTVWGGTVGEDGASGLQIGPEYPGSAFLDFQRALLAVRRRGILLAVNSKNDEADVLAVLEAHPAMLLRPEHFAARRINWTDKSSNMESIAAELNIGLDAMVFIDDNPAERERMRHVLPEVLTPEWPADPVDSRAALESLCDFATVAVTAEDLNRPAMYAAQSRRDDLRRQHGSLEDYLFALDLEVVVARIAPADVDRVAQLIQKTNQFNLTTRRHSRAEIEAFAARADARVYTLRSRDAFGDNGLVGVAILVAGEDAQWRIDSLLLSCRILGRTIESAFLHVLLDDLRSTGARAVLGEYVPTPKNGLVSRFFADAGFTQGDAEGRRWRFALSGYAPPAFPWIRLTRPASDAPLLTAT